MGPSAKGILDARLSMVSARAEGIRYERQAERRSGQDQVPIPELYDEYLAGDDIPSIANWVVVDEGGETVSVLNPQDHESGPANWLFPITYPSYWDEWGLGVYVWSWSEQWVQYGLTTGLGSPANPYICMVLEHYLDRPLFRRKWRTAFRAFPSMPTAEEVLFKRLLATLTYDGDGKITNIVRHQVGNVQWTLTPTYSMSFTGKIIYGGMTVLDAAVDSPLSIVYYKDITGVSYGEFQGEYQGRWRGLWGKYTEDDGLYRHCIFWQRFIGEDTWLSTYDTWQIIIEANSWKWSLPFFLKLTAEGVVKTPLGAYTVSYRDTTVYLPGDINNLDDIVISRP